MSEKIIECIAQSPVLDDTCRPLRVLMVEDDKFYFAFVHRLLSNCRHTRFEIVHAANLTDAHRHLLWENPDIILLDMNLPDSSGLQTLDRIKQSASGCPVIILTGSDDQVLGLQSVARGAQDYLIKQHLGTESLIRSIRYSVERRKSEEASLRLAAIRDFTAALAHDLKVPLIGTDNVFDALLDGHLGALRTEIREVLLDLSASNKRQLELVQRLLEVYRYETGACNLECSALDLKELITNCVVSATKSGDTAPVSILVPNGLPKVRGDREGLVTLFGNLLDNAIKFGDGHSPITITGEIAGERLAIRVHNYGPPIAESMQSILFRKFWQGVPGKSYVANTGFGLYLCHRIVALHHGRISCHSTKKRGTTISVVLPAIEP